MGDELGPVSFMHDHLLQAKRRDQIVSASTRLAPAVMSDAKVYFAIILVVPSSQGLTSGEHKDYSRA